MTEPDARSSALVAHPRFSPDALATLRALVDTLLASADGDSPHRKGAGHEVSSGPSTGLVQAAVEKRSLARRRPGKVATAAVDAVERSGARRGDHQDDEEDRR